MTCRDIERLILEAGSAGMSEEERRTVEAHLRDCPKCRKFKDLLLEIRSGLETIDWEPLSEALDRRTKRMALDVLRKKISGSRKALPGGIVAALGALTVLTVVWVTASLASLGPELPLQDLSLAARLAILFIAQNAFVLFFTPVILRAMRPGPEGNHGFSSWRINND